MNMVLGPGGEKTVPSTNGDQSDGKPATTSDSQESQESQTAAEFINSQLQLEADAREVLPYQFDTCTYPLGPLRQNLFSCLTCNPPPTENSETYFAAGVCYSCSISCHGGHDLVELFSHRNFVCDCGTKRLPATSSCSLRLNKETGRKGGVHSEEAATTNRYNQNFGNRFCGCGELYDPHKQKGTMFQCLGLGTIEEGGCGEDWWHPECLLGLHRESDALDVNAALTTKTSTEAQDNQTNRANGTHTVSEDEQLGQDQHSEMPLPPGFPDEDDFEHLICYKCVNAFPWIKRYAGAPGFLPAVSHIHQEQEQSSVTLGTEDSRPSDKEHEKVASQSLSSTAATNTLKRKSPDETEADEIQDDTFDNSLKKPKISNASDEPVDSSGSKMCKYSDLSPAPAGELNLFLREDFRDHICRCPTCFPRLKQHLQLLEEEETYSPPLSEAGSDDGDGAGTGSVGSRSLLDRGEAALSNMDRVRAIEAAMAYNHLRDKVKDFLKPFADNGQAVGAEDVKAYFAKLRGDEAAMKEAAANSGNHQDGVSGDGRREQGGY